jgi:hypothetical protein
MRIGFYDVFAQFYLLPTIKITHDRILNGDLEIIFVWFNKAIVCGFKKK